MIEDYELEDTVLNSYASADELSSEWDELLEDLPLLERWADWVDSVDR